MLKKYSILIGLVISIILLLIAMMVYPGGTNDNLNSVVFAATKYHNCEIGPIHSI